MPAFNRRFRKAVIENPQAIVAQLNEEVGLDLAKRFLIDTSKEIVDELKVSQRYASSSRTIWKGMIPYQRKLQKFRTRESPRRMYWRTAEMKDQSNILMNISFKHKNRKAQHESESATSLKKQIAGSIRRLDEAKVFFRKTGAGRYFYWIFYYNLRSVAESDWSHKPYGEYQETGFHHVLSGKRVRKSNWLSRSLDQVRINI